MHVARQAVEFGDQYGHLGFAGCLQRCGQLRPTLQGICTRARFDFLVHLSDAQAFRLGKASNRGALRFQSEP